MKIRTLIYVVILLLVVNVAALVTIVINRVKPEPPAGFGPGIRDGEPPAAVFTPEERKKLEQSRYWLDSTVAPVMEQMRQSRKQLFDELSVAEPDTLKVFALVDEIAQLQFSAQRRLVERFIADRGVLSPEQRARLLRMIEERGRGPMPGRFGEGRRGKSRPGPMPMEEGQ